ncbi:sugar kinase [Streptomyces sp. NPDC050560]|uniref:sugar kinase n=1 Tax=Streptomyces sp. NPDC050560 TaxID=3365630 RepID=UPI00378D73CA
MSRYSADVLTFGETMLSLRAGGPLKLGGSMAVSVAGSESNTAIGLARLGHRARWAGCVGDDEQGELVLRTLRAEGVDVSGAARREGAYTGLIMFEPRLPEVTRVSYYRTGSAGSLLGPEDVQRAFADGPPRVLHLTGITPALGPTALAAVRRALELTRSGVATISLDVNYRSRMWTEEAAAAVLGGLVPLVDVLVASEDELPLATGAPADRSPALLLERGVREVVVKQGAGGATVVTADGSHHLDARRVPVADPVGAGDAFTAGYLSALLDGEDIPARLDRAVTTGAFAVAAPGDWEGAPTRAELPLLGAAPGTVVR